MMRVCHLDTCPVGVATQNPVLREKFSGQADHVVNFFRFIAEEVRELLAELGFKNLDDAIGHSEYINTVAAINHWKAQGLDLSGILYQPQLPEGASLRAITTQDHGLSRALDNELIEICKPAIESGQPVRAQLNVRNVNRTVGTMLGSAVTRKWGGKGLPEGTIDLLFTGSAGQSFGAFLPAGITLRLEGDSNDYVGKGLSGGRIVVRPIADAKFNAQENIIAGNVIAYGATSGKIFLRGMVGERFCVRNSGATAIVEGIGDHGLEYMTGGLVIILGETGRNFAAGMSGGIAFVYDPKKVFDAKCNKEMVSLETADTDDTEMLKAFIEKHSKETKSEVADRILANFNSEVSNFVKVFPTDYKRVLLERKKKTEADKLKA
jgi:glutamate synthase (NADPH/NADH) large chain